MGIQWLLGYQTTCLMKDYIVMLFSYLIDFDLKLVNIWKWYVETLKSHRKLKFFSNWRPGIKDKIVPFI